MKIQLTPKETYRQDKEASQKHSDIMAGAPFKAAASAALLEYQYAMASQEPQVAAVTAFKLKGAQEFLGILLNLGEPDEPRRTLSSPGLIPPEEDRNLNL